MYMSDNNIYKDIDFSDSPFWYLPTFKEIYSIISSDNQKSGPQTSYNVNGWNFDRRTGKSTFLRKLYYHLLYNKQINEDLKISPSNNSLYKNVYFVSNNSGMSDYNLEAIYDLLVKDGRYFTLNQLKKNIFDFKTFKNDFKYTNSLYYSYNIFLFDEIKPSEILYFLEQNNMPIALSNKNIYISLFT